MAMLDQAALQQAKKGQGETNQRIDATNQRLDALIREQQQTNYLLGQLVQVLTAQRPQQPAPTNVSWGTPQG